MKITSSNLVFFGNERLSSGYHPEGAPVLEALINNGYTVSAVVSHYIESASRNNRSLEIADVAKKYDIPLLLPDKPSEIIDQLKEYSASIGILVAYGRIVPQEVIDIFPHGIINIHPSLLPKYRGSTPIEQALINGDAETGVSIMKLSREMDAGPIFAQKIVSISSKEKKSELTLKLHTLGMNLIIDHLPSILDGSAKCVDQVERNATYTKLLTKKDSLLDTTNNDAATLERQVRAHAIWPKSKLHVFGVEIIVLESNVIMSPSSNNLVVDCKNNSYLEITLLIAPSGKKMNGSDFLRGYQK